METTWSNICGCLSGSNIYSCNQCFIWNYLKSNYRRSQKEDWYYLRSQYMCDGAWIPAVLITGRNIISNNGIHGTDSYGICALSPTKKNE